MFLQLVFMIVPMIIIKKLHLNVFMLNELYYELLHFILYLVRPL